MVLFFLLSLFLLRKTTIDLRLKEEDPDRETKEYWSWKRIPFIYTIGEWKWWGEITSKEVNVDILGSKLK